MTPDIPDTSFYFFVGYLVFGCGLVSYILSLVIRWKNKKKEFQTIMTRCQK